MIYIFVPHYHRLNIISHEVSSNCMKYLLQKTGKCLNFRIIQLVWWNATFRETCHVSIRSCKILNINWKLEIVHWINGLLQLTCGLTTGGLTHFMKYKQTYLRGVWRGSWRLAPPAAASAWRPGPLICFQRLGQSSRSCPCLALLVTAALLQSTGLGTNCVGWSSVSKTRKWLKTVQTW